ncbi:oxygenase MpaB family protein [Alcanivorax sp.]|jgi:hypothetical protein|uniref:oxygenase MpaB family protein n=1 Tax=Alcanivorax sp. TaxID=1872427 RepID=UPI0032D94ED1
MQNVTLSIPKGPVYRKRFGFMPNPAILKEIDTLDEEKDCQRIVYLMLSYEFTHEIVSALDLAYLASGVNKNIADILGRSHYLKNGLRRYDDTRFLIFKFLECGWDDGAGAAAIEKMNSVHARYKIRNEDFVSALSAFIVSPILWIESFGWRKLSQKERQAWFNFWIRVGSRMSIQNMPASYEEAKNTLDEAYANKDEFSRFSARLGESTLSVFVQKSDYPFRFVARWYYRAFYEGAMCEAYGVRQLPMIARLPVFLGVKTNSAVRKLINFKGYPFVVSEQNLKSYPGGTPTVSETGPAE